MHRSSNSECVVGRLDWVVMLFDSGGADVMVGVVIGRIYLAAGL